MADNVGSCVAGFSIEPGLALLVQLSVGWKFSPASEKVLFELACNTQVRLIVSKMCL